MRKLLSTFVSLLVALTLTQGARAQTPTPIPITGNVAGITGGATPYAGVSIELVNCPAPISIPGYAVIAPQQYQLQADGTGLVNSTIWPIDDIDCNGTTGAAQYSLTYIVNGTPTGLPLCYQPVSTLASWNLSTLQPISCSLSPPNPQDAQFRNLTVTGFFQGQNGAFGGNLAVGGDVSADSFQLPAAQNCDAGLFMNGLTDLLQPICVELPATVSSFNGRSGAVTPQTGDYSYSQISGTPAINYQILQSNSTPLTARLAANFSARFILTDDSVDNRTGIDLNVAGTESKLVTAPANFTLNHYACGDAAGGIADSSIPCGSSGTATTVDTPNASICSSLSTSTDASCTGSISVSQPDTSYTVQMQPFSSAGAFLAITITSKTTSSVGYVLTCTFNCASYGTIAADIRVHHN